MKIARPITTVSIGILLAVASGAAAHADSDADSISSPPTTVVISGHTFGPEDGLEVIHESYEITSGEDQVGAGYPTTPEPGQITPMDVWGSSYAYSQEILYVDYKGYGKAAANVYQNKRIVAVCFWWSRTDGYKSATTCSSAKFNGGWQSGPEVIGWGKDSLDSYAPATEFNIETTRIDPSAHW